MTSGGYTMTEGWNLQLQGRVRDLEADLAEAEKHLTRLTQHGVMRPGPAYFDLARGFLKKMAAKREKAAAQAKDIDAFLEQEGASDTGDGSAASKASEPPPTPR